jgi:hypothetical protein
MAERAGGGDRGVLEGLVEGLKAESEAVGGGGFRLDFAKAREKLAAYQLAVPARFVLLLVEAGHLLRGCAAIEVWLLTSGTEVVFAGVDLDAEALRGCFDVLFVGDEVGDDVDGERAHRVGRQRLAMAINAGLDLSDAGVEVTAIGSSGTAVGRFRSDAPPAVTRTAEVGEPALRVSFSRSALAPADDQRALLREDERFAALPLHVDGVRVGGDPDVFGVEAIAGSAGEALGRAGWSPRLAREGRAECVFVANGVAVERVSLMEEGPGFVAVIEAGALARDLSQTKLRRDGAFARRIAAAEAAHARMAAAAPRFAPSSGEGGLLPYRLMPTLLGLAFGGGALVFGDSNLILAVIFMVVAASLVAFESWRTRLALRRRRILRRGRPALVRVDRAGPTGHRFKDAPEVEVGFTVVDAASAGTGPTGTDRLTVDDASVELFKPGARFFACVSRDDPRVVLLEQR